MHVAVDLSFIIPTHNRGTQTYVDNLLPAMSNCPGVRVTCLTNAQNHDYYSGVLGLECRRLPVDGRNRLLRVLYQQFVMQMFVGNRYDVMLCPGYLAPAFQFMPTVTAILDMNYLDIPYSMRLQQRVLYNLAVPRSARKSKHILTISQFSKDRITSQLGIPGERVSAIHLGPLDNGIDRPCTPWTEMQMRYGIRDAPFLSISSGALHKNVARMIHGFGIMRENADVQLVVVGHELDGDSRELVDRYGLHDSVIVTGYVPEADKLSLLRNSLAYIYPSLYEGFGLPVLEAQACKLPVASSTYGSLPEVCGDSVLYFNARHPSSISHAMMQLYEDAGLRGSLKERGYENLRRFSWESTAMKTAQVLAGACGQTLESN